MAPARCRATSRARGRRRSLRRDPPAKPKPKCDGGAADAAPDHPGLASSSTCLPRAALGATFAAAGPACARRAGSTQLSRALTGCTFHRRELR